MLVKGGLHRYIDMGLGATRNPDVSILKCRIPSAFVFLFSQRNANLGENDDGGWRSTPVSQMSKKHASGKKKFTPERSN